MSSSSTQAQAGPQTGAQGLGTSSYPPPTPSSQRSQSTPPSSDGLKITFWRLINTCVLLGFGIAKGVLAYQKQDVSVNSLDITLGVVWAIIALWVAALETDVKDRYDWLFYLDVRVYVGFVVILVSSGVGVCVVHYWVMTGLLSINDWGTSATSMGLYIGRSWLSLLIIIYTPAFFFFVAHLPLAVLIPFYLNLECVKKFPNGYLESRNWNVVIWLRHRERLMPYLEIWIMFFDILLFTGNMVLAFDAIKSETKNIALAFGIVYVVPLYLAYICTAIYMVVLDPRGLR